MQTSTNTVPVADFLARRYRLPIHTAAVVAELAGLGRVEEWQPIGAAVVPTMLRAAAARLDRRRA